MNKTLFLCFLCVVIMFFDLPLGVVLAAGLVIAKMACYLMKNAKIDKKTWITLLAGIIAGNVFLLIYNSFQNFIPYWDYAGYYIEGLSGREEIYKSLSVFLKQLYVSMLESDYTKLPAFFISPFFAKLSGSYASYIMLNYNLFLVPFFIALSMLVYKIDKSLVALVFLFPPFYNPLLRGYIDAVGLLFAVVWLYVIYKDDFEKTDIKRNIVLAIFTAVFIFTRRWFLFFIVAAFAAKGIVGIINYFFDRKYNLKSLILNLFITGIILLGIMLLLFMPYMKRLFTNGFSDIYSAYNFGSLWWNIKYFIKYYGVIVFALALIGAFFGMKNNKTRSFTLFLCLQSVIMFLMFTRIQTISYHHQYLFATNVLLLIILGLASVRKYIKPMKAVVLTILVFYTAYSFLPMPTVFEKIGFTAKRFEPKVMAAAETIKIKDRLNELTRDDGGYVYILSSSELLNDDMLKNSELPYKQNAVNNLFGTAHVDKRDGFPNVMLVAKYIVVAEPLQVHLGEENQRIIQYFTNVILDGSQTPNLTKIESHDMGNGVTAHIYRRDYGYTEEFLNGAKNYFATAYPEYENLNNIDMVYSRN